MKNKERGGRDQIEHQAVSKIKRIWKTVDIGGHYKAELCVSV